MASSTPTTLADLATRQRLADHAEAYRRLRSEIINEGLLERSLSYYFPLILVVFAAYLLSGWAIWVANDYLWLTAACLSFTFFTVQLAGLMHDGGHRAAFSSVRNNNLLGLASTSAIGMVFANWVARHNLHHAHPNQVETDPDITVPFLTFSQGDYANLSGATRFFARWQALYYYPLGSIVSFSNRLGSISYFLRNRSRRQLVLLVLYLPAIMVLLPGPFLVFPLDKALFVFGLVHISTGLYLASCFAPNHKGMPLVDKSDELSFLEQQVTTSRNVRGGLLTDILLVGLNYQIEHHLFPTCPRNKLNRLAPYVRRACAEQGIPYSEVSFVRTNLFLVKYLHGISRGVTSPGLVEGESASIA